MLGAGAERQAGALRRRPSACHQEKLMRRAIPPDAAQAYGFSRPFHSCRLPLRTRAHQ
jgi:hypothetical protein